MRKSPLLRRYWITFESDPNNPLGCGVTAYSIEDALRLLQHEYLDEMGYPLKPVKNVTEDVDVRTLDQGHVVPNVGLVSERGVWFPRCNVRDLKRP